MPRREGQTDSGSTAVLDRDATVQPETNGTAPSEGAQPNAGADGVTGAGEGTGAVAGTGEAAPARARRAAKRDPATVGPEEIISLNVRVPNALRALMAKTAEEQKTSVPQLIAGMLANAYAFTLPTPARPPRIKKYDTPEQRKQAQKDAQAHQRLVTKAVLKAVEDGSISLDIEALVAKIKADEAAKAASGGENPNGDASTEGANESEGATTAS